MYVVQLGCRLDFGMKDEHTVECILGFFQKQCLIGGIFTLSCSIREAECIEMWQKSEVGINITVTGNIMAVVETDEGVCQVQRFFVLLNLIKWELRSERWLSRVRLPKMKSCQKILVKKKYSLVKQLYFLSIN